MPTADILNNREDRKEMKEGSTYSDTINSANEIKARGAKIIGISDRNNDVYDYWN